ncbi:MAG: kinetochore protein SPC24 [Lachnospiraceae bacterium]|nr:kinetochore protein SPC24 [Ruminococcus sp.]MCM1275758.1 kinetochore protein SPC24 [Lachnospiraceae bacterium]
MDNDDPNKGTKLAGGRSGKGGDGGYVLVMHNVKIPANVNLSAVIAERNNKTGTSLNIEGATYKCNDSGSFCKKSGDGGWVPSLEEARANGWEEFANGREDVINKNLVQREKGGEDGTATPCTVTETINGKNVTTCYVGSSGSGGAACNGGTDATALGSAGQGAGSGEAHRSAGTDAVGYGCGGGGGATCGNYEAQTGRYGGCGKQGCIIIAYVVEQKTLIVEKRYKKKCTTNKSCKTNYATSQNSTNCCTTNDNGCGCGSSSNNYLPSGVIHDNSDTIKIRISKMSVQELMTAIQKMEAENLELMKQIEELESKLNKD